TAAVVDVVFARDLVAREGEQTGKRVAEDRAPHVADMHRAGGVGGNELDIDAATGADVGAAEVAPLAEDLRDHREPDGGIEPQVEETGPGDLGRGDARIGTEPPGNEGGNVARLHAGGPGKHHRGVRCHVAMGGIAWRLDGDGG